MRVLLIGQQAFGRDVLARLEEQGEHLVGVLIPPGRGNRVDPLREQAVQLDIPYLEAASLKDEKVFKWVADREPDLFCLAFVDKIVPGNLLALATQGGVNYHPSLLPRYRGGSAMQWAVLAGEKETGVTIHYIDEGIDSGDIILQERVTIDPHDSVKTLYFEKLYPLGIKLLAEAVALIRDGRAPRQVQDHAQATYDPLITEKDLAIQWQDPVDLIYRQVRAGDPAPGASTNLRGDKLKVWSGRPVSTLGEGQPGEIVAIDSDGFVVRCGDGCFQVERVQIPTSKKTPAPQLVEELGLQVGEILGMGG